MKRQCHPYYLKNCWNSIDSLVSCLLNNVIYNKGGLVVFNKPYGLMQKPVQHSTASHVAKNFLKTAAVGDCNYTLQEALPYVAQGLKCRTLHIVKTPERYESGIGILASSDAVVEKVKTCFRKAKPMQRLMTSYWGVVVGVPQPQSAKNTFGVKLKVLPGGDKQAMLTEDWSQTSVRQGTVKVTTVQHRTLHTDPCSLTSLVEVMTSRTKWHFVRLYLSYLLSPVLGDNLFGSRVAEVLGQKVLLPIGNDATKLPQKLKSELMSALMLQQGWEVMLPVHLHLRQLTLIGYLHRGKEDLVLQAPVPDMFKQTCDWLGLELPDSTVSEPQTAFSNGSSVS